MVILLLDANVSSSKNLRRKGGEERWNQPIASIPGSVPVVETLVVATATAAVATDSPGVAVREARAAGTNRLEPRVVILID